MTQADLNINLKHPVSMVPAGLEKARSAEVDAFIIPEGLDASKLEFRVSRKEPGLPELFEDPKTRIKRCFYWGD